MDESAVTLHLSHSRSQSQRYATVTPVEVTDVPLAPRPHVSAQCAVRVAQSEALFHAAVAQANTSDPAIVLMAKRSVVLSIHPETARLTAYLAFWCMVSEATTDADQEQQRPAQPPNLTRAVVFLSAGRARLLHHPSARQRRPGSESAGEAVWSADSAGTSDARAARLRWFDSH